MRTPIVAGNWKMNLNAAEGQALVNGFGSQLAGIPGIQAVEVVVCPPAVYLQSAVAVARQYKVAVGAQNLYQEPAGAYTGEVSAAMLRDVGCTHVIIGHSERRHTIGHQEDDRMVNLKVRAAMAAGLVPILCVGETLAERQAAQTMDVLTFQLRADLVGVKLGEGRQLVLAYEPVWAIGTGQNATADQAQEAHSHLRSDLRGLFGGIADEVRILYGGSLKPDNAAGLLGKPDVDGGLIGGASLKADSFLGIIRAAAETTRR